MKTNKPYRIILSGGGTGGHIFPAIAIANEIRSADPSAEILFVGASGKMEMEMVPRAGYKIVGLPVSAFHRRLSLKNLLFPFRLLASLVQAARVMRDFRPDLVIGTGGFASGPVLRVTSGKNCHTLIQEQNSYPGVTNRLLAKKVDCICVAYPGMDRYFPAGKIILTGNPVRRDLLIPESRISEARLFFNVTGDQPVILIFGGSQGARTINRSLLENLDALRQSGIQVIWQTGTTFFPSAASAVEASGAGNIRVYEFIHEMDLAYALADLVVCRSGAITLSELALLGKPALLIPYPDAAENHQAKNAQAYVDAGAAILVTDQEAPGQLVPAMLALVHDQSRLLAMAGNMTRFAKPNAVRDITAQALNLLSKKIVK